ncbi:hypothetical protein, partial [Bradyrhizobium japonicum]
RTRNHPLSMFETKTPLPETEAAFLFVLLSSAAAGTELYLSRQNTLTPIPRREQKTWLRAVRLPFVDRQQIFAALNGARALVHLRHQRILLPPQ